MPRGSTRTYQRKRRLLPVRCSGGWQTPRRSWRLSALQRSTRGSMQTWQGPLRPLQTWMVWWGEMARAAIGARRSVRQARSSGQPPPPRLIPPLAARSSVCRGVRRHACTTAHRPRPRARPLRFSKGREGVRSGLACPCPLLACCPCAGANTALRQEQQQPSYRQPVPAVWASCKPSVDVANDLPLPALTSIVALGESTVVSV